MRHRAPVVLIGLAVLLVACSSSKPAADSSTTTQPPATVVLTTTTPSTLAPGPLKLALAQAFGPAGTAIKLLEFERASASIATGTSPTTAQCRNIVVPLGKIGSSDEMYKLAASIPDPALSKAFHDDIAAKRLLLAACQTSQLPPNAAPAIKRYNVALRALLRQRGYNW